MRNRCIILAALSALLYLPTLFGGFMWDDEDIITGDTAIHSLANAPKVFTPGYWKRDFPGAESRFRPLRSLLLMAEWQAWGANPQGYHAVRILLNALAVCLAFWLSFILLKDPDKAFAAALLFAVHPVHVESVAWLKNVSDILAFCFMAVSAALLLRGGEESRGLRLAATASFLLALAGKESAAVMPVLVLAWLAMSEGGDIRSAARRVLPELAIAAAFLAFTLFALRRGPGMPAFEPLVSLGAFAQYLRLLFLPFGLNAERGVVTALDLAGPALAAAAVFYFWRKGEKAGLYGVVWMLVCLLPFLDNRLVTGRPIAEQRLYAAVLGLGLAAGAAYGRTLRRALPLGLAVLMFSGLTLARTFDWISPVRFWEKTVASSPDSPRARNNLGVSYERAGRLAESARQYELAYTLSPVSPAPFLNMADLLYRLGRREEAKAAYAVVFSSEPANLRAGLGLFRLRLEDGDPGVEDTLKALRAAHPGNHEVLNSAGVLHMVKGEREAAAAAFSEAITNNPGYPEARYNLAMLYQRAGETAKAEAAYAGLLELEPRHANALNNLAILKDMAGDEAGAMELLRRAAAAAPEFYPAAYNLGGIYYRKKLYLEALSEYTRVLKYRPDHAEAAKKAAEMRKKLDETAAE